jgi:hypothetical protein
MPDMKQLVSKPELPRHTTFFKASNSGILPNPWPLIKLLEHLKLLDNIKELKEKGDAIKLAAAMEKLENADISIKYQVAINQIAINTPIVGDCIAFFLNEEDSKKGGITNAGDLISRAGNLVSNGIVLLRELIPPIFFNASYVKDNDPYLGIKPLKTEKDGTINVISKAEVFVVPNTPRPITRGNALACMLDEKTSYPTAVIKDDIDGERKFIYCPNESGFYAFLFKYFGRASISIMHHPDSLAIFDSNELSKYVQTCFNDNLNPNFSQFHDLKGKMIVQYIPGLK